MATITMLSLDLHHGLLLGFAKSFEVLPLGGGQLSSSLFETVVARTSQIFVIALQIAAPIMAVSFCITMFFALMSRAVPQMNVFAESFGIRIACGLIVLGFTLQIAAQYIVNYLQRLPDDMMARLLRNCLQRAKMMNRKCQILRPPPRSRPRPRNIRLRLMRKIATGHRACSPNCRRSAAVSKTSRSPPHYPTVFRVTDALRLVVPIPPPSEIGF